MALGRTVRTFERSTVVEATGLTPQAVSKVIARLSADGLIRPAGVRRTGIGKPAVVYELVPDSRYAIGAHVARRTLRLVLVDLAGTVHHSAVSPLPGDFTPEQLLDALTAGIDAMTGSSDVRGRLTGVGIGMIGPLDHANGLVRDAHGLRHWHDVPLREIAEKHLGLPVHLDKDVTAGITAEAWRHGATFGDAALIMVESGIGGGFWLGGAAHRGAHTNAGEFGHTVVDLNGPRCVCGRHGCLEIVHDQAADAGDIDRAARVAGGGRGQPAPDTRPRPRGAGGRGSPTAFADLSRGGHRGRPGRRATRGLAHHEGDPVQPRRRRHRRGRRHAGPRPALRRAGTRPGLSPDHRLAGSSLTGRRATHRPP